MTYVFIILGLFLLGFFGFVFGLKMSVARERARTGLPHPTEMSAEVRHLTAGLRRQREELMRSVRAHRDLPELQVIGNEALETSADLIIKVTNIAQQRDELRRAHQRAGLGEEEEARLELRSAQATSVEEKAAIEKTLANYRHAKDNLEEAEGRLGDFGQQVRDGEAVLAELHSKMLLMTTLGSRDKGEDLRETLSQLHSLSSSLDEVEATLTSEAGR